MTADFHRYKWREFLTVGLCQAAFFCKLIETHLGKYEKVLLLHDGIALKDFLLQYYARIH